jgi:G3E family GTPase
LVFEYSFIFSQFITDERSGVFKVSSCAKKENMKLALTGGFLGSGKTTAIVGACQQLMAQNKKVAVITNDQGDQQVDTALIKSFGIPGREVANGCFCCNYEALDTHVKSLVEIDQPDIIFAEPVGSCTDLIATIAKPLNKLSPDFEVVISVFADADLLASILEGRSLFIEESVRYIYKKQLEEADLLVINKKDLITDTQRANIDSMVSREYPGKIILYQNSLHEDDISEWLLAIDRFTWSAKRNSLEIDYDIYGEGESRLAWLDKSITINAPNGNAVFISSQVIGSIFNRIQEFRYTIGHLKFYIETTAWKEKISFTTTSTHADVKLSHPESDSINILINARVQTEPALLATLIDDVLANAEKAYGCSVVTEKWAVFKPGYPKPVHRIA